MTDQVSWGPAGELRQALFELQRYLSDKVAPLMVADSMELLLEHSAQLAAGEIHAWVSAQYRSTIVSAPVSDYLFHAFKKIHDLGEFKLVSRDRLNDYLNELEKALLPMSPDDERERLEGNLRLLNRTENPAASPVEILHRQTGSAPGLGGEPGGGGTGPGGPGGPGVPGAGGGAGSGAAGKPGVTSPRSGMLKSPAPAGPAPAPAKAPGEAPTLGERVTRGLRRFSMMMERLERAPKRPPAGTGAGIAAGAGSAAASGSAPISGATHGGIPADTELARQLLTLAALTARTSGELNAALARLQAMGLDTRSDRILGALGRNLPGWGVFAPDPVAGGAPGAAPVPAAPVEALHQFVVLAEDRQEAARRFHQLIQTAIEQFNEGALAVAVTLLELGERIIAEKKVDQPIVAAVRQNGHRSLDNARLREYADRADRHLLLRKALNFFEGTRTDALLAQLWDERKRDRRHLLLGLLEVQGETAREAALARLENVPPVVDEVAERYYQRNLLALLRRIPRPLTEPPERELTVLTGLTSAGTPVNVLRESILALGQTRQPRAEEVLIGRLREFEDSATRVRQSPYTPEDLQILLDRVATALARFGSAQAWSAVVEHALKKQPAFGDAMARLADLGTQDISRDPEILDRLLRALRDDLPMKVFGLVLKRRNESVLSLVRALSGTNQPAVRQVFEEIVQRYPDTEFAETASRALTAFGAPPRPAEASPVLSGDLDLFGLPNLLQSLADSRVTGQLLLSGRDGAAMATLALEDGRIASCQSGELGGDEAMYRLFEKPTPGSFTVRRNVPSARADGEEPREVLPLILEGLRRHDEYQQARAFVPDEAQLRSTGRRPTRPDDETDQAFLKTLWTRAAAGAVVAEIEPELKTDPYRVRRVLAHWAEEGSLAPRPPAPARGSSS